MFNVAFAIPWNSIEKGGLAATIVNKLNVLEYFKLLDKVPKYEEPSESKPTEAKVEAKTE